MSKKDAYVEQLKAQLDEWNAEVDKLKTRADKAQAEAQQAYLKQIEALRDHQQAANAKLNELRVDPIRRSRQIRLLALQVTGSGRAGCRPR